MRNDAVGALLVAISVVTTLSLDKIIDHFITDGKWTIALVVLIAIVLGVGVIQLRTYRPDANKIVAALLFLIGVSLVISSKLYEEMYHEIIPTSSWILDMFVLLSIVALMSVTDPEDEFLGVSRSLLIMIARAIRATCVGILFCWILIKLGIMSGILAIFGDADRLIMTSLILFIVGPAAKNFAEKLSLGSATAAIGSAVYAAFWYTLMAGIVAYILLALNLVGPNWNVFLLQIWKAFAVLAVAMAFIMFLPKVRPISVRSVPHKLAMASVRDEIYRILRTQSLILPGNVELIVKSDSYLMPLTLSGVPGGVFIFGEVSYNADLAGKKIRGEADKVCIVTDEDTYRQIFSNLHLQLERDIIYFGELSSSAKEALEILRNHFARSGYSIVELPFIKVYSGEDMEYVKVGPITVMETKGGEYVKIGPIEFREGRVDEFRLFKETLIGISDIDKGWVFISLRGDKVRVSWGGTSVSSSPGGLSVRRGKLFVASSPQEYKFVWGDTVIKVERNAAKVVTGSFVLKVNPPFIKLVEGSRVARIVDNALANDIISELKKILSELPMDMLEGERPDRVIDLIRNMVMDKISGREYKD